MTQYYSWKKKKIGSTYEELMQSDFISIDFQANSKKYILPILIEIVPPLEDISSVYSRYEDFIRSKDFIKFISIIMEQVPKYKNILSIFTKLQLEEFLATQELEELSYFFLDKNVIEEIKILLEKLENFHNSKETENNIFTDFLNEIFTEKWYANVVLFILKYAKEITFPIQEYTDAVKWEITELLKLVYNLKQITIILNWWTKEILLEEESLKVDSQNWKKITIDGIQATINPDWNIIEIWWTQFFTWEAAIREAQNQWKRLPTADELKAIIKQVWHSDSIFSSTGYISIDGTKLLWKENCILWTSDSIDDDLAICIALGNSISKYYIGHMNKFFWKPVHCIVN